MKIYKGLILSSLSLMIITTVTACGTSPDQKFKNDLQKSAQKVSSATSFFSDNFQTRVQNDNWTGAGVLIQETQSSLNDALKQVKNDTPSDPKLKDMQNQYEDSISKMNTGFSELLQDVESQTIGSNAQDGLQAMQQGEKEMQSVESEMGQ